MWIAFEPIKPINSHTCKTTHRGRKLSGTFFFVWRRTAWTNKTIQQAWLLDTFSITVPTLVVGSYTTRYDTNSFEKEKCSNFTWLCLNVTTISLHWWFAPGWTTCFYEGNVTLNSKVKFLIVFNERDFCNSNSWVWTISCIERRDLESGVRIGRNRTPWCSSYEQHQLHEVRLTKNTHGGSNEVTSPGWCTGGSYNSKNQSGPEYYVTL